MHYKIFGKSSHAVVLIHGFIEEGSMWNNVAKALSKNYKVIVPDLEGFGHSPLQSKKLSMEKYTQAITDMLEKEKIKKCVMLGHSMGGYITLHFAEKHPTLLSGFGLINSHCFADTEERKENRKKGNEFISRHGTKTFVRELYRNLFYTGFKNEKLIEALIIKAEKYTPEALIAANTAMMNRENKEQVLKNSTVPVLLISGRHDESVPVSLSLNQAAFAPNTELHIYNNSKHMSIFENKTKATATIFGFINRCYEHCVI